MKPGKFISFEGTEGCGKSTQAELLYRWLQGRNIPCLMLREPGGTAIGEKIRYLLKHDPSAFEMCPETELLLFSASRAQLVRQVLQPTLGAGTWVICDRFLDSTTVYQGYARGIDLKNIQALHQLTLGYLRPDKTFILEVSLQEAQKRLSRRVRPVGEEQDRIEAEPADFFEKVHQGYRIVAEQEPGRICLIQAEGKSKEDLSLKIQQEILYAFSDILG